MNPTVRFLVLISTPGALANIASAQPVVMGVGVVDAASHMRTLSLASRVWPHLGARNPRRCSTPCAGG